MRRVLHGVCAAALLAPFGLAAARAEEIFGDLRAQVESLASRHGFVVVGRERLALAPAQPKLASDPARNLRALLGHNYNYHLLRNTDGGIRRRIILADLAIFLISARRRWFFVGRSGSRSAG